MTNENKPTEGLTEPAYAGAARRGADTLRGEVARNTAGIQRLETGREEDQKEYRDGLRKARSDLDTRAGELKRYTDDAKETVLADQRKAAAGNKGYVDERHEEALRHTDEGDTAVRTHVDTRYAEVEGKLNAERTRAKRREAELEGKIGSLQANLSRLTDLVQELGVYFEDSTSYGVSTLGEAAAPSELVEPEAPVVENPPAEGSESPNGDA